MKTVKEIGSTIAVILFFLAVGFCFGYGLRLYLQTGQAEIVEKDNRGGGNQFDLQLPGEVTKRIVTKEEIVNKLEPISELATYSSKYTISKTVDSTRNVIDNIPIPGTTNTISLECTGIVKVGYDITEINPTIDNKSQKIYIALPAPSLLDNYVIWDSVTYTESNSILNPIAFGQYKTLIEEIEQAGLEQAKKDGVYDDAEEHIKSLISIFLAGFEEYEIVFI